MKEYKSLEKLNTISRFTVFLVALTHSGYFLMFYFLKIYSAAYFKAAEAIIAWVACLGLIWLKDRHNLLIYYTRASVIFSCSVCHILLGPAYGFDTLLLLTLAIGYMHNFRSKQIPSIIAIAELVVVICACYVGYFSPNYPSPYAHVVHFVGLFLAAAVVMAYAQFSSLLLLKSDLETTEREENIRSGNESDPLSGLYNRATMSEVLKQQMQLFSKQNACMCLALLDLDGFKKINSSYGYKFGDLVVFNTSQNIKKALEGHEENLYAARWSGQEFLISSIATPPELFTALVQKIIDLNQFQTHSDGYYSSHAQISAGVAICERALSIDNLLHKAETALYNAKRAGGSQLHAVHLVREINNQRGN